MCSPTRYKSSSLPVSMIAHRMHTGHTCSDEHPMQYASALQEGLLIARYTVGRLSSSSRHHTELNTLTRPGLAE